MRRFTAKHTGRIRHIAGSMNKMEVAYSDYLKQRELAGEIQGFDFEAIKFRLADKTFYTPDFIVYAADGCVELHEVKGHWEDDARVKIKVFASKFPFRVIGVTKDKTGWHFETLTAQEGGR